MTGIAVDYSRYFWQGDKVRLRPLRSEDAADDFANSLDSPARQLLQLGIELPSSLELAREALEKYAGCKEVNGVFVLAVETLDGTHVGGVSMHSRSEKNGLFGLGGGIMRPYRGHGYAEDAGRIMLRYGFWERRYQKCNSACLHTNEASIHLHKKMGFVQEGRRRRQVFFNDIFHDELLFGLTREEFDAREGK